ncbi:DNA repair protein RecO [Synechococcus sp. MIT S1220]|uniref:DNA repair protein RecO n=1 Tax=Synechococcus sp. MIT S1220 TaxID=3082549 RepID=UPI0039AF3A32
MGDRRIEGLALKVGPLGEHDRLLTLLSETEGVTRLAVPGARRPRSSLAAAAPLTLLELQVGGRRGLARVRQLKVHRSFAALGRHLETLAAAQSLTDLCLQLSADEDPIQGLLPMLILHLERLEALSGHRDAVLASAVQGSIHLLTLGGYSLPLQSCCRTGEPLNPPIGQWHWRCSLLPEDGFAIGSLPEARLKLNPSELALLQRLSRSDLPRRQDGTLMGPVRVWLRLLTVVEIWVRTHLPRRCRALAMLHETLTMPGLSDHDRDATGS